MLVPVASRVFCIGRNYAKHMAELGQADAERCVIFMKPASCLVPAGATIALPRGLGVVHHEAELVVMLGKGGRNISAGHAVQHISAVTLGLDLTLRELQQSLRTQGSPWERSKAFDSAAPIGELQPLTDAVDLRALQFECRVNGELRQLGDTRNMLYPVPQLVAILSQHWTLQPGDLIYTGTPEGVGAVKPGDAISLSAGTLGSWEWRFN